MATLCPTRDRGGTGPGPDAGRGPFTDRRARATPQHGASRESPRVPGGPDQAVLDVRRPQDRPGVLQGRVHRPGRGADLLRRAGAVPGHDRAAVAGRAVRAGAADRRHADSILEDARRRLGRRQRSPDTLDSLVAATPGGRRRVGRRPGDRAVVGVRVRRRVRPRDEPDVRGRRGPADLEAAPAACSWSRLVAACWWPRRRARPGGDRPGRRRRSATRSAWARRRCWCGTSRSGR